MEAEAAPPEAFLVGEGRVSGEDVHGGVVLPLGDQLPTHLRILYPPGEEDEPLPVLSDAELMGSEDNPIQALVLQS